MHDHGALAVRGSEHRGNRVALGLEAGAASEPSRGSFRRRELGENLLELDVAYLDVSLGARDLAVGVERQFRDHVTAADAEIERLEAQNPVLQKQVRRQVVDWGIGPGDAGATEFDIGISDTKTFELEGLVRQRARRDGATRGRPLLLARFHASCRFSRGQANESSKVLVVEAA